MTEQQIIPEKVTKPIQLLAAWLVGLIAVDTAFLLGAQQISKPEWASSLLVIAAVVNVPLFIGALFLLQTRFRPQMQEDAYYSQYLQHERKYIGPLRPDAAAAIERNVQVTSERIAGTLGVAGVGKAGPIAEILRDSQVSELAAKYSNIRALSELFSSPDTWTSFIRKFGAEPTLKAELQSMKQDGLLQAESDDPASSRLTDLGVQVAEYAQRAQLLVPQTNREWWEITRAQLRA